MNIVIIGNGKVGMYLAEQLLRDGHQITVIDNDPNAIERSADALDVMFIEGSGTSVTILNEANVSASDIVIAVTGSDEINMLCCMLCKRLGAKYSIARIRDKIYNDDLAFIKKELLIDLVVNPESLTALEIVRMIQFPLASEIESFVHGRVDLVGFRVEENDFLAGCQISQIMKKLHNIHILFCVVERDSQTYIPNGSFTIRNGDKIYVIGDIAAITNFFKRLGRYSTKVRNVLITGGGRIAYYLARQLTHLSINTKLIEIDPARCVQLSEALPNSTIIGGDGTNQELLESERIAATEAFVALTGRDEDNLITALYAQQRGVKKVIAKNNRVHYTDIVHKLGLEDVVSTKTITGSFIMQFIRGLGNSVGSEMLTLHQIANNRAEVMEFLISDGAKHLNVPLRDVPIADGVLVAAIVRDGALIIPDGEACMMAGDRVILAAAGMSILQLNDIFNA